MRFFILRAFGDGPLGTRYAYADVEDPVFLGKAEEQGVCPRCGQGLGMLPWLPPQRMSLSSSKYPDFLWGTGGAPMLSDGVLAAYEDAKLRGITRVDPPAEIVRVGRKPVNPAAPPPDYHKIWYRRGGANLDDRRSGARRPRGRRCGFCRVDIDAVRQVLLQEGSWQGDDIFEAYGLPADILITERFASMIERCGLTNGEAVPAEFYRFDFDHPERNRRTLLSPKNKGAADSG